MKPNANLHDNHRGRMRDKYAAARDSLTDHELLEMLLFHIIPRKNTNPIAHRLLAAFGSLQGVLSAEEAALITVEGVGKTTARFLTEVGYFYKRVLASATSTQPKAEPVTDFADYLLSALRGESAEAVYLLLTDGDGGILNFSKLVDGALTAATVDSRAIATAALTQDAAKVILVHNHPEAGATPSDDDVAVTRFLRRILAFFDLSLAEHYLVSGSKCIPLSRYLEAETGSCTV